MIIFVCNRQNASDNISYNFENYNMHKGNHNTYDKTDFARIQMISFKQIFIALKKITEEKVLNGSFQKIT